MKEDAVEKPRHPMRGAVVYALVLQILWAILYLSRVPAYFIGGDMTTIVYSRFGIAMVNSLIVSAALFWLFVVYLAVVRGRKITKGDLLVVRYGVPVFSLVTLFIMSALFAIRYREWPSYGPF